MYCPNCGTKNQDNDRFCMNCGSPLEEPISSPKSSSSLELNNSSGHPSSSFSTNWDNEEIEPNTTDSNGFTSSHQTAFSTESSQFKSKVTEKTTSNQETQSARDKSSIISPSNSNQSSSKSFEPSSSSEETRKKNLRGQSPIQNVKGRKGMGLFIGGIILGLMIGGTYLFFNEKDLRVLNTTSQSHYASSTKTAKDVKNDNSFSSSNEFSLIFFSQEATKESKEKSAISSESSTQSFDPYIGKYKTNYVMKVRAQPNYEGERIGRKEQDVFFEVIKSEAGPNNSIWGQLPEGGWICLQDADLVYASGIQ